MPSTSDHETERSTGLCIHGSSTQSSTFSKGVTAGSTNRNRYVRSPRQRSKVGLTWAVVQDRCEPRGYTPMDDPRHFERRNSDLHDFRKFSRTRSFTYGEIQAPSASSRSTLPPCPPLAFAAASAAVGRRQGPTIAEEDHEHDSSPLGATGGAGDSDRIDASPCPRVVSMGHPPIFGSSKPRAFGRVGFARVASYAGTGQRP